MKKDINKVMIKRTAKSFYIDSDLVLPHKTRRIECVVTEATFGKVSYHVKTPGLVQRLRAKRTRGVKHISTHMNHGSLGMSLSEVIFTGKCGNCSHRAFKRTHVDENRNPGVG